MAVGLTVRVDTRQVEIALAGVRNGLPRVLTRAINRSATTVRTRASRAVAEDIGVPVRTVNESMVLQRATPQRLRAVITITGRRIPLIDLRARGPEPSRGRGRGVSYALGGTRRRIQSAFIATMRSGHRGVFKRIGTSARKSPRGWSSNLPIVELKGPSIPRVAAKRAILEAIKAVGEMALLKNIQHEVRFLMSRQARTRDQ
jgi:hypothetical protein